jgi:hypothetical protein
MSDPCCGSLVTCNGLKRVCARGKEGTTGAHDRLAWYMVTSSPHAIHLHSNSPYG